MTNLSCRFCSHPLRKVFADLGVSPLANSLIDPQEPLGEERFFPLTAYVCEECLLVQLPEFESPEHIFSDYAYFSSYSDSWLEHARRYTELMIDRFGLGTESRVIEIASNDGYLLRYFRDRKIPILGIEPAANVAESAVAQGIPTRVAFFGTALARELAEEEAKADLLLGNNVLAHVPDLNDFVAGLTLILKPTGIVTMEFPHLMRLVEGNQFDTIYHEHFSYFSLRTVQSIFRSHGLEIFDVEELPTHGGSLRTYACRLDHRGHRREPRVEELLEREEAAGLRSIDTYLGFGSSVRKTKRSLLRFLIDLKEKGHSIAGYGAPAKGNTLLNYCGIGTDFLDYTVDRNPHKQNRLLPGSRVPVFAPEKIRETQPDFVFILPWNLRDEIAREMRDVREWGGRFFVAIPTVEVF
jgi:SAM-dependent methyltransferase